MNKSAKVVLATANILYRRPDYPWLLQTYVWQNYDLYLTETHLSVSSRRQDWLRD